MIESPQPDHVDDVPDGTESEISFISDDSVVEQAKKVVEEAKEVIEQAEEAVERAKEVVEQEREGNEELDEVQSALTLEDLKIAEQTEPEAPFISQEPAIKHEREEHEKLDGSEDVPSPGSPKNVAPNVSAEPEVATDKKDNTSSSNLTQTSPAKPEVVFRWESVFRDDVLLSEEYFSSCSVGSWSKVPMATSYVLPDKFGGCSRKRKLCEDHKQDTIEQVVVSLAGMQWKKLPRVVFDDEPHRFFIACHDEQDLEKLCERRVEYGGKVLLEYARGLPFRPRVYSVNNFSEFGDGDHCLSSLIGFFRQNQSSFGKIRVVIAKFYRLPNVNEIRYFTGAVRIFCTPCEKRENLMVMANGFPSFEYCGKKVCIYQELLLS